MFLTLSSPVEEGVLSTKISQKGLPTVSLAVFRRGDLTDTWEEVSD